MFVQELAKFLSERYQDPVNRLGHEWLSNQNKITISIVWLGQITMDTIQLESCKTCK